MSDEKRTDSLRDGIAIFAEYGAPSYAAEHDVFFCSQPRGIRISLDDQRKLYALGWFYDSDLCEGCADDLEDPRDPNDLTDEEAIMQHRPDCDAWAYFV